MAPKRKRRASPPPKGLAPGEFLKRFMLPTSSPTPWSWVGAEVTEMDQITPQHRVTAYGFSPKSGYPCCRNQYSSRKRKATSPPPIEDDGDVITVSDDDTSTQCSKKACKNNPFCLNYLGQDIVENEDKAQALFSDLAELGEDPMHSSRDPDIPVGLKNLGATCYANSSLQVWFRDVAFRNGVYGCRVPGGNEEEFKESPIFNLQVTFAALQEGRQSVFNPSKLVESLQLRTAEQQDAQEFSKLFMSHLDAEFKKQLDPTVQNLIPSQFQGSQVYGTICHSCKYTSERSSDFLEVEVNIKANSRLEDRIRGSLEPEILSKDNQYLCPQCNSLQDATRYTELRQLPPVLHFSLLRFVYDLTTMERKKSKHVITFPLVLDMGQFIGKCAKEGGSAPEARNVYELRGVLLHKGSSAYHGHYEAQVYDTQLDSWFQFNDETVTKISDIGDKNRGPKAARDTPIDPEKSKKNSRKKRRIVVDSEDEDESAPPSSAPVPVEHTISSKDAYMLVYTRKHTLAVPNGPEVPDLKPPPLALGVVEELNDAHEKSCEEHEKRILALKAEFDRRRKAILDIFRNWQCDPSSEGAVVVSQKALKDWVSKSSIKLAPRTEIESCKITPQLISIAEILCEHDKLDPDSAKEMKLITQGSYDAIVRETQCKFEPLLTTVDVCEECVASHFKERLYEIEHPRIVKDFDAIEYDDMTGGYWISKAWLRDWRLQRPRMHEASCDDPPPDGDGYLENVICDHGGLIPNHTGRKRISNEAKKLLQGLFPRWSPPATDMEPCAVCQASISMSKEDKREMRKKAEEEKAKLKHMNNMAFRFFSMSSADDSCAIIPTQFYTSWKRWVDNPTNHPRPENIETEALLCPHSQLLYDPGCREDMGSTLTLIRRDEWGTLSSLYPIGPAIFLQRKISENSETTFSELDPLVCTECKAARKLNWDSAEITVQLTEPGKREDPVASSSNASSATRHSRRLRNKQGDRRSIRITKSTTIKDIRIEISEKFDIPTICQRLFFQQKELVDNGVTVGELVIGANDTLFVEQVTEAMEIDSDSEPARRGKPRDEGQGFNGTILGGCVTDSSSRASSSRAESPASLLGEISCKACTFANPIGAPSCEVCGTTFE